MSADSRIFIQTFSGFDLFVDNQALLDKLQAVEDKYLELVFQQKVKGTIGPPGE